MSPADHERAGRLIDAGHVEEISAKERDWLEGHLAGCMSCQAKMRLTEQTLQMLRSNSITIDPALVSTTQVRLRVRTRELRESQIWMRALWVSCALSWVLGVASAPLVWRLFQWMGAHASLPRVIWESAFALWWLLPAGTLSLLFAWNRRRASTQDGYPSLPR